MRCGGTASENCGHGECGDSCKYNTAPGEPIILFPANATLGYKKPSEHDADEYDEGETIPETEQEAPSKESEAEHTDNDADEQ